MIKANIIRLGIAKKLEKIKKFCHPRLVANIPANDENRLRDNDAKEENKAYWVALNFLLHKLLRYATNIASPMPEQKFSIKTAL